ncbi:MAG: pantoate--beta-alanine ligase [SAR202 cluster bacterium]|nr:pantoate--beta-alanine ligase [SAR202 cluster bacterium]
MKIYYKIDDFLDARSKLNSKKIILVPTMGSIHEGHISLINKAKSYADIVIVTIFINPIQFNSSIDYDSYPRSIEEDKKTLEKNGVDILFCPSTPEIYPEKFQTSVNVRLFSEVLEGKFRKGHMEGVATIVTKLFNLVRPDFAIFGEKDFQQLLLIKSFVQDLNIPVKIISGETIRDNEGLALSSRNEKLTNNEKTQAIQIIKSLNLGVEKIRSGEKESDKIIKKIRDYLEDFNLIQIEYISIRDVNNFEKVHQIDRDVIVLIATFVGKIRLIDNLIYRKKNG